MKLTARVSKIESGANFTDGIQRAVIKFDDADGPMYSEIRVQNVEKWEIDKVLVIDVYHPTLAQAIASGVARG